MKKSLIILATVFVLGACNNNNNGSGEPQTKSDSVSSSADSIKNAVDNLSKDSTLNTTDSAVSRDSLKK